MFISHINSGFAEYAGTAERADSIAQELCPGLTYGEFLEVVEERGTDAEGF